MKSFLKCPKNQYLSTFELFVSNDNWTEEKKMDRSNKFYEKFALFI